MPVPLLDLDAQYRPLRDALLAAMTRVADSQRFIMGPEIDALEHELAAMLGVRHAVAVSSGTDALLLALMALDIKAGDEVVTPTFSFFATAGAVVRVGARPVLVDIDPATFNIDPAQTAAAITPRTKAIMPVHLFGLCADLDPIMDVASRAGIPVIEDAAQAIGATYKARPAGGIGAFGCFSFFPSKNLGAFGDAGLLTTNDDALADARAAAAHARHAAEVLPPRRRRQLPDGCAAGRGAARQGAAPGGVDARRAAATPSATAPCSGTPGWTTAIVLPQEPAGYGHIFNQFVIRTPERDALKRHLDEQRIGNEIYYPVPFHLQPCFADLGYRRGAFPHAERAADESLAIPIYGELTAEQQETVVSSIAQFVHRKVGVTR